MLQFSTTTRVFVHRFDTDMRKSFDGLHAIVKNTFGLNVLDGDLFVFFNRSGDRCKILLWDRDGLVVWAKRLERGSFQRPTSTQDETVIEVDATTLALILSGIELQSAYVKPDDKSAGVIPVPVPPAAIEGGKYDVSIHAAVVTFKYGFHLPTYREQELFSMFGWFPNRSTLNDLMNQSCELIVPLYEQFRTMIMRDNIVMGDDTQVKLLTRGALDEVDLERLGKRRAKQRKNGGSMADSAAGEKFDSHGSVNSYVWCYRGLDDKYPYNIFDWSLTRQHATVGRHLIDFRGTLCGDAFGGNTRISVASDGRVAFSACNVHARREFVRAEKDEPELVAQALSFYRQLYAIEERGRSLSAADRLALRQSESVLIWQRMGHWSGLQIYLSDGRLPIDNSATELTIRPWAIGRKNWMFLGHPSAAVSRLQLYSIVSSAARHQLVLPDFLEDVLARLSVARSSSPAELELDSELLLSLLPDRWAASHSQSVCVGRRQEQAERSETTRAKRALGWYALLQHRQTSRCAYAERRLPQGVRHEAAALAAPILPCRYRALTTLPARVATIGLSPAPRMALVYGYLAPRPCAAESHRFRPIPRPCSRHRGASESFATGMGGPPS